MVPPLYQTFSFLCTTNFVGVKLIIVYVKSPKGYPLILSSLLLFVKTQVLL